MNERPRHELWREAPEYPYHPLTDAERDDFVETVYGLCGNQAHFGRQHRDRPIAVAFHHEQDSPGRTVLVTDGEPSDGVAQTVIRLRGWSVENVSRVLWGEQGGFLLAGDPDGTIRQRDLRVLDEYLRHPEEFEEYNPDDALPWEPAE